MLSLKIYIITPKYHSQASYKITKLISFYDLLNMYLKFKLFLRTV